MAGFGVATEGNEMRRLESEKARLLEFAVKGRFSETEIDNQARRIEREKSACLATIQQAERELRNAMVIDKTTAASSIAMVFAEFEFLHGEDRKSILRKFVSAFYVDAGAITKATLRLPRPTSGN